MRAVDQVELVCCVFDGEGVIEHAAVGEVLNRCCGSGKTWCDNFSWTECDRQLGSKRAEQESRPSTTVTKAT
jgi:hypothetical protein